MVDRTCCLYFVGAPNSAGILRRDQLNVFFVAQLERRTFSDPVDKTGKVEDIGLSTGTTG